MKNRNIIISEGSRPLWQRIIAAMLYTVIVYLLFSFFIGFEFTTETKKLKGSMHTLELAILLLPTALFFSMVKDVLFDLNEKKYKIQYCVGPIKFGGWNTLPEIENVSIFKQLLEDGEFIYEVNLWYQKNKHFNIYRSTALDFVFSMGKNVAKVLKVDLLDATEPNNYKWVKNQ